MDLGGDLIEAYKRTRKNKRRSEDSVLFEMHWERNLRDLRKAIEARNLRSSAYTFVRWDPRPREIFACNMGLNISAFLRKATVDHRDVCVFGSMSTANLQGVKEDERGLMAKKAGMGMISQIVSGFVIGSDIITEGIVCFILSGEELEVVSEYALGWNSIGRDLELTLDDNNYPYGESCISKIDGEPAVDIYKEALGVEPDEFFVKNICEFPFMIKRDDIEMCVVPFEYDEQGRLYLSTEILPDDKVSFSFASKASSSMHRM